MSDRATRLIGLYAAIAGLAAVLVTPLLALAYFATDDGAYELDTSTVSAWAKPGRDLAGGLLTFASTGRVYGTYLQAFAVIFPAALLCALAVRSRRPAQQPRLERWGWRAVLVGYAVLTLGLVIAFGMETAGVITGTSSHSDALNVVFLSVLFPGVFLSTVGSSLLGAALVRSSFAPRTSAWLLALAFPLWIAGSFVLGHNGVGLAPILIAWGVAGLELWRPRRSQAFETGVVSA